MSCDEREMGPHLCIVGKSDGRYLCCPDTGDCKIPTTAQFTRYGTSRRPSRAAAALANCFGLSRVQERLAARQLAMCSSTGTRATARPTSPLSRLCAGRAVADKLRQPSEPDRRNALSVRHPSPLARSTSTRGPSYVESQGLQRFEGNTTAPARSG